MFSKFYPQLDDAQKVSKPYSVIPLELQNYFGSRLEGLYPVGGGTHGIGFFGNLDGKRKFFKTYNSNAKHSTVARETYLLQATAHPSMDVRAILINGDHGLCQWLVMDFLNQCSGLTPLEVRGLLDQYIKKTNYECSNQPYGDLKSFDDLIEVGKKALWILASENQISREIENISSARIDSLIKESIHWPKIICHGDFGPANIMQFNGLPIAIDWEDAFLGVSGYDYLYWLTFFENRKWLVAESLGWTPFGRSFEIDILVMIIVIKSAISVLTGQFYSNSITFNQRINEVLCLE